MVKVIIKRTPIARNDVASSWDADKKAVHRLTTEKESHAFRETKAAGIPVTYVSKGTIYRESDGRREVIGHVAPRVKIVDVK